MSRASDDFDYLGKTKNEKEIYILIHDKMLKTEVIGKALNIQFFVTVMYIKLQHH